MTQSVLVIDDDPILSKNIGAFLTHHGHLIQAATSAEEGLALVESFRPEVILLDLDLPGMNGLEALRRLQAIDPDIPVIMMTGQGTIDIAVEAIKSGASEFIAKPISLKQVRLLIDKTQHLTRRELAFSHLQHPDRGRSTVDSLVGDSVPMQQLKSTVVNLLQAERQMRPRTPPTVLVAGETGTGKGLVARALHFDGSRQHKPFIELNCAALPEALLESELFGHERGAFSGATQRKLGLIEAAHGGTLFLDEVGDMPLAVQVKLLKVLEDQTIRRIGGLREIPVDVRIVAATHQSLDRRVRSGQFRSDLYFRLQVMELKVPALREREGDWRQLADAFLGDLAKRYGRPKPSLDWEAEVLLAAHTWPGNVRELRNALEQAMLLDPEPVLHARFFALASIGDQPPVATPQAQGIKRPMTRLPERFTDLDGERLNLISALERHNWNITKTADALGVARDALRYRIKKLKLVRETRFALNEPATRDA